MRSRAGRRRRHRRPVAGGRGDARSSPTAPSASSGSHSSTTSRTRRSPSAPRCRSERSRATSGAASNACVDMWSAAHEHTQPLRRRRALEGSTTSPPRRSMRDEDSPWTSRRPTSGHGSRAGRFARSPVPVPSDRNLALHSTGGAAAGRWTSPGSAAVVAVAAIGGITARREERRRTTELGRTSSCRTPVSIPGVQSSPARPG